MPIYGTRDAEGVAESRFKVDVERLANHDHQGDSHG
jgi:hypothetical protein